MLQLQFQNTAAVSPEYSCRPGEERSAADGVFTEDLFPEVAVSRFLTASTNGSRTSSAIAVPLLSLRIPAGISEGNSSP